MLFQRYGPQVFKEKWLFAYVEQTPTDIQTPTFLCLESPTVNPFTHYQTSIEFYFLETQDEMGRIRATVGAYLNDETENAPAAATNSTFCQMTTVVYHRRKAYVDNFVLLFPNFGCVQNGIPSNREMKALREMPRLENDDVLEVYLFYSFHRTIVHLPDTLTAPSEIRISEQRCDFFSCRNCCDAQVASMAMPVGIAVRPRWRSDEPFFYSSDYADFWLIVGPERERVPCHRFVLSSTSGFFEGFYFYNNDGPLKDDSKEFVIPQFYPKWMVIELLRMLYDTSYNPVLLDPKQIALFYRLVRWFQCSDLINQKVAGIVAKYAIYRGTCEEILELLQLVETHNDAEGCRSIGPIAYAVLTSCNISMERGIDAWPRIKPHNASVKDVLLMASTGLGYRLTASFIALGEIGHQIPHDYMLFAPVPISMAEMGWCKRAQFYRHTADEMWP